MSKRPKPTEKHFSVARQVIHEDVPFRQAAVNAGFSKGYGDNGQRVMRARVPALDQAFTKVSMETEWRPEELRKLAVYRITKTALQDKNSDNLKAAELIGKMKAVDLFVRNGEAQTGVFVALLEHDMSKLLPDAPVIDIEPEES